MKKNVTFQNVLFFTLLFLLFLLSISNMYFTFFVEGDFYQFTEIDEEPDPFDLQTYLINK